LNIFILNKDPIKSAEAYVKMHLSKMILEFSQLLSTAIHETKPINEWEFLSDVKTEYKTTHKNHPCAIWVRSNPNHFKWLAGFTHILHEEFKHRRNKSHLAYTKLSDWKIIKPDYIDLCLNTDIESLSPPKCMPDEYKSDTVVQSYRNYYSIAKSNLHDWECRQIPEWINIGEQQ
jgi:hypothetical protein